MTGNVEKAQDRLYDCDLVIFPSYTGDYYAWYFFDPYYSYIIVAPGGREHARSFSLRSGAFAS